MAHTAHTASRTTRTLNSSGTFLLTLTALTALTILTVLPATFSLPGSALAGKLDDIKRSAGQSTSKGASARDAAAWYQTGEDYYYGQNGRSEDKAQAAVWYRKAAEAGYAKAQSDLGYMYLNGLGGLPQDDSQVVFWCRKGADAGNVAGQYNLALMYEQGRGGLSKDRDQAIFWYRKAAAQGLDEAQEALRRLTADQSGSSSQLSQSARPKKLPTYKNSLGMEFLLIPAGTFQMGCSSKAESCFGDEKPPHRVTISKPFYLGRYEVTQKQWEEVMGSNPSQFKGPDRPVENVDWDDIQTFIRKLNAKEGHKRYRLPTEAEWEYAARAGSTTIYSFGDNRKQLKDYAWFGDNAGGETHPVGQKQPNPWGLHDVHGNVWEVVQDGKRTYSAKAVVDPRGAGEGDVMRGSSWENANCRVAIRFYYTGREPCTGFRLALTPEK